MSDIKLKPCPYCGSDNIAVQMSRYRGEAASYYYALCGNCKMAGPEVSNEEGEGIAEEQAAAAWNSLPRLLHWTTETPTEPGWYWCRSNVQPKDAAIVLVRDGAFELDEELIEAASLRFQWAGPIPEPQEQP